jgi:hypothetical protein
MIFFWWKHQSQVKKVLSIKTANSAYVKWQFNLFNLDRIWCRFKVTFLSLLLPTAPLLPPSLSSHNSPIPKMSHHMSQAHHLQTHRKGNCHTQCPAKPQCQAKHHSLIQYCSPSLSQVPSYVHSHPWLQEQKQLKDHQMCHLSLILFCEMYSLQNSNVHSNVLSTVNQAHCF